MMTRRHHACHCGSQVDRKKTPWLIVSFHAPWYNSYAGHFKENECMRLAYEKLLVSGWQTSIRPFQAAPMG